MSGFGVEVLLYFVPPAVLIAAAAAAVLHSRQKSRQPIAAPQDVGNHLPLNGSAHEAIAKYVGVAALFAHALAPAITWAVRPSTHHLGSIALTKEVALVLGLALWGCSIGACVGLLGASTRRRGSTRVVRGTYALSALGVVLATVTMLIGVAGASPQVDGGSPRTTLPVWIALCAAPWIASLMSLVGLWAAERYRKWGQRY